MTEIVFAQQQYKKRNINRLIVNGVIFLELRIITAIFALVAISTGQRFEVSGQHARVQNKFLAAFTATKF